MKRVATPGYLRYPHVHGDLLTFVTEDDVWLAPAEGGRAWRLTSDGGQAGQPAVLARRGHDRVDDPAGTAAFPRSTPPKWTAAPAAPRPGAPTGATCAPAPPAGPTRARCSPPPPSTSRPRQRTHGYAVPLDAPPRRLPFGQVNDLALTAAATALLTGQRGDPAYWKRYRGGTGGRLWVATGDDPLFTRVLSGLAGQLASPMLIGGRLVFLSDHEGTGNVYSAALDGTDLRRHTDHDGFYARNPATDGTRVVYHVAGDIWTLDSLDPDAQAAQAGHPAHHPAHRPRAQADHRRRPPGRPRLRPDRPGERGDRPRHRALAHPRRRPGPGAAGRPGRPRPAAPRARQDRLGRLGHRRRRGRRHPGAR